MVGNLTMNGIKWRISLSPIRYLFIYVFSSESYAKLLISSKYLEKETKEVIEEVLAKAVHEYLKLNDLSGDNLVQAMKSFTEHLVNVYKSHLVTAGMGIFYSLYLILQRSYYIKRSLSTV